MSQTISTGTTDKQASNAKGFRPAWLKLPVAVMLGVGVGCLAAVLTFVIAWHALTVKPTQHFTGVDQAVSDIQPQTLGVVVSDSKSGSGRPLSQSPTRIVTVRVEGSVQAAEDVVAHRLNDVGFEKVGPGYWQRTKGGMFVTVSTSFDPGTGGATIALLTFTAAN